MSAPTADGLIVVLGWSPDDFESSAREAKPAVLEEARKIVSATFDGEGEYSKMVSAHAVRFIDVLAGSDGRYWEREKTRGQ